LRSQRCGLPSSRRRSRKWWHSPLGGRDQQSLTLQSASAFCVGMLMIVTAATKPKATSAAQITNLVMDSVPRPKFLLRRLCVVFESKRRPGGKLGPLRALLGEEATAFLRLGPSFRPRTRLESILTISPMRATDPLGSSGSKLAGPSGSELS